MDLNDEVAKCKKNGWLDVWMAFETVAINKETVENALKIHIEKIGKSKNKDVILYEKNIKLNISTMRITIVAIVMRSKPIDIPEKVGPIDLRVKTS